MFMRQPGFFDLDERYSALSKQGDPLEVLNESIPWSTFRPVLKKIEKTERKSNAGRKRYDPVLMFKVLVLQSLYNLSDEQAEYQIRDRLSFMRFLGLKFEDTIPDATTIWLFREALARRAASRCGSRAYRSSMPRSSRSRSPTRESPAC